MQEKQLKKRGNGNTNHNSVFQRIKCAETGVSKKKKKKGVFASICMLWVYSLNYFLHFAQVWGTSAEQIPLVGCSQDPRKRAASPAELTSWGGRCSLMCRSDGESFSIFFTLEIRSDYILKPLLLWEKPALWVFCLNISRRGHYDSSSRSCLFTPCRFPDDRKRARQGLWLERFRSTSCRNQTPSLCHQLFFFFFDEQQTGWKTLKWSDYGSGSQSEAVEEKRRLRGNAVWKPEVRKR